MLHGGVAWWVDTAFVHRYAYLCTLAVGFIMFSIFVDIYQYSAATLTHINTSVSMPSASGVEYCTCLRCHLTLENTYTF
jgi:hypothetical protein